MTRWIVLAVTLLAALAGRLPAGATGVMLVQAGAFWMGRDDGPLGSSPRSSTPVELGRPSASAAMTPTIPARIHLVPAAEQHAAWVADAGFEHYPVVEVSWFGARDGSRISSATCASGRRRRCARTLIVPTTDASRSTASAGWSSAAPATTIPRARCTYRPDARTTGAAAGHHHVGFRCATSEDLGGY
jgi:hypothetical protein